MCGIAGIILKKPGALRLAETIREMSTAIAHRGPDGEGFITASDSGIITHTVEKPLEFSRTDLPYRPQAALGTARQESFLAFAHRRLSIIDLSEAGHQPMCDPSGTIWLTFNGEIYNYIELRGELQAAGHRFISETDSEVIIAAYRQWGTACVERFNGMWAFCIYDSSQQVCIASRDRLGVKPFYYIDTDSTFAFASEQKAFIKAGLCEAKADAAALHQYLVNTLLETSTHNFFSNVRELWPGHNLEYDLNTGSHTVSRYFHIRDIVSDSNDGLSEKALVEKISETFYNAVKLRLRSDVEVGTCLSGGLDSSALAVTIAAITGKPLSCFTSVFRGESFNEEAYADVVAHQIGARHFKVEPTFDEFSKEVDRLVYSQDVPIWDTSTYAQFRVMQLAKEKGIKVVLDGQGADELFAGYHHHFVAKWNGLLRRGQLGALFSDISASRKTFSSPLLFFAKEKLKERFNPNTRHYSSLLKRGFISGGEVINPATYESSVNAQLIRDIYDTRLKSFLKCEDRCGMWHSVESRTPFSDDAELIRLMFSFNGNKKIRNGVSKYLLREATRQSLPAAIYSRYDKRGFETPMRDWVSRLTPMMKESITAAKFDFVNGEKLRNFNPANSVESRLFFRLFILSRWQRVFGETRTVSAARQG